MTDLQWRWKVLIVLVLLATVGAPNLDAAPPGQLTANPLSFNFGTVTVGSSLAMAGTFTNTGGTNLTISQDSVSGNYFQLSGLSAPLTLAPNQSASFSVTFTPQTSGSFSGTMSVTFSAQKKNPRGTNSQTTSFPLSGTGTLPGQLTATPASIAFTNVQVGNSQTLSETLTNSGSSDVTITQATVTGAGFSLSGLTLPVTLPAGQSTAFSVTFSPQAGGAVTGNIAIISNAPNSTLNIALSGTGVTPGLLAANPSSLSFGSVQVGSSQTLSETLTNSGGSDVTITQATVTGTSFSLSGLTLPVTLAAGQSKAFSVAFAPQSGGAVTGNIAVISNASNSTLNIALSGTGVTAGLLAANPSNLNFGNVQVGNSQTLSETLTNSGGSDVTITQATVTGAGFSLSGLTLPVTLAAGQSKTFSVAFAPQVGGAVTGNLAVISNGSNPTLNIALSGTGVTAGLLAANPSSLNFGSVQIGNSQTLSETLTNSGGSDVTITQASVSGAGFSLSGLTLPVTLAAGQSKTFSVAFAPQVGGAITGNIAVISNASNSTLNIALSGTGMTAGLLAANPSSLNFGNVQIGNNQTLSETLTNSGGSDVTITQATVTGAGFSLSGLTLPVTLAAGQSKTFSVAFAPQVGGAVTGNLAVISNGSNPTLNIALSGAGVTAGLLAANPSSLSFGSVQIGNSQTLSETLTNSGGSDVTITQATTTGAGFSLSGLTLPVTLASGQSKTFSVAFAPQVGGAVTGSLAVISNGSNPTLNIALSGLGVTAGLLAANPTSLNFGNVQIGNNQTLSETLTNSGGSDVTITQATVTGAGFSLSGLTLPVTLAAGQTKTFSVAFAPQVGGAVTGNLAVISNASNSTLNIALSGTGATAGFLSANPSSLSFGSVQVGSSKTLSEALTNSGGSTVIISQATVTGTGFSLSGLTLPLTLTPGQSFTFSTIFAPLAAGSVSGSISVISNGSNPTLTISLSGTGTAAGLLTVTPATLDFGSVVVGSSKNLTGALSASGSSVTVSSVAVSTAEFAVSGVSFPFTIAAGQSTSFTVTFKPQASGTASASASFVSNASNSPTIEALTGTGTPAPQHSVDLSWSASISQVAGYNVYRGSNSGGPYSKINSALDVTIAYTDSSVQAGLTYFYVTTAVDTNGMESKYSNEVQAVIPTP